MSHFVYLSTNPKLTIEHKVVIGLLVNLHDQKDILQITVLYHVGSPCECDAAILFSHTVTHFLEFHTHTLTKTGHLCILNFHCKKNATILLFHTLLLAAIFCLTHYIIACRNANDYQL